MDVLGIYGVMMTEVVVLWFLINKILNGLDGGILKWKQYEDEFLKEFIHKRRFEEMFARGCGLVPVDG